MAANRTIAVTVLGALMMGAQEPEGIVAADAIRTFEFLAHRVSIRSTDDEAMLFDWTPEQYFTELRAQKARGEDEDVWKIEWVAAYDGLVWGRSDSQLAAQWYGERRANDRDVWTYFRNADRHKGGFKFPGSSRLMGVTDDFVYHGWPITALDFYAPDHEDEFPHVWVGLALAQQIFLACASPSEAFRRYACQGLEATYVERSEVLPDGRVHSELVFTRDGLPFRVVMRVESAGEGPDGRPPNWRFIQKNSQSGESLIFLAEWRETTSTSERSLPSLPKDVRRIHADVDRIDVVGVRDRTGLGLWDDRFVEYLKVTPGVAAYNWFSSESGRWLTNIAVFIVLFPLLWRESLSSQHNGIHEEIET